MANMLLLLGAGKAGAGSSTPSGIYVSAAGSNSNAGTQASPYLTIAKAVSVVAAGQAIYCRGGDTFAENVTMPAGTTGNPITLTSYGTGQANIQPASGSAVIINVSHIRVTNIKATGLGNTAYDWGMGATSIGDGYMGIRVNGIGGVAVDDVQITYCTATAWGANGIYARQRGGASMSGLVVRFNDVHNCGSVGITLVGANSSDVHTLDPSAIWLSTIPPDVSDNHVYDIQGSATFGGVGYGIQGTCTNSITILRNYIHDCGLHGKVTSDYGGGNSGIMVACTDGSRVAYNEIHNIWDPTGIDGIGVDTDGASTNCIVEKNYVRDCWQAAFMDYPILSFGANVGNIFRNNIHVATGGAYTAQKGYRGPNGGGGSATTYLYHNTFYDLSGYINATVDVATTLTAKNNIFLKTSMPSGGNFVIGPSSITLSGNAYYQYNGVFRCTINGSDANSLADLQGGGYESGTGSSGSDVYLYQPNTTTTIYPSVTTTLIDYEPLSASPVVGDSWYGTITSDSATDFNDAVVPGGGYCGACSTVHAGASFPGSAYLVGNWKLNEASGNATDYSGNSLTLADNNSVGSSTGLVYANARSFVAASNKYLSHSDSPLLSLGADTDFTIEAWVNPLVLSPGSNVVINKGTVSGSGDEYLIWYGTGGWEFYVGNGSSSQVALVPSIAVGTWQCLIAWHNSTANTINICLNNGTVVSQSWSGGTQDTTNPLNIGSGNNGAGPAFDGLIGPVRFWKGYVPAAASRARLYNSGAGVQFP